MEALDGLVALLAREENVVSFQVVDQLDGIGSRCGRKHRLGPIAQSRHYRGRRPEDVDDEHRVCGYVALRQPLGCKVD